MKKVFVSPETEAQLRAIDAWWSANRTAAPGLFLDEFAEAVELLRNFPGAGQRSHHPGVPGVRRLLLRSSRFHVYHVEAGDEVIVVSVWSAVRGRGPDLSGL
ncbi:MAG: type II toxin-antitoxin system RelE/ParE family toxin [Deltaproteobacteria bacterium]|nr:type II toxin-antitoxin system RelE/ParE family toxin [Deltaproteobacteria bacterium]